MMLLKLTKKAGGQPVYVARDHIVALAPENGFTTLVPVTGLSFDVRETVEQIAWLAGAPIAKPE